jgi:RimJ/RimL family protein N-acetyltransferase
VFIAAIKVALDFIFTDLSVHRLEARSAVQNGRGMGALRKLGAVEQAVLRRSLRIGAPISIRCCGRSAAPHR